MKESSYRDIQHLYSRFGFGAGPETLTFLRQKSGTDRIMYLISDSRTFESLPSRTFVTPLRFRQMSADKRAEVIKEQRREIMGINFDWFSRMCSGDGSLRERLALFWHDHFACNSISAGFTFNYLETLRRHALGNFRTLLFEVSKSPAMLQYLNNQQNRKQQPNENFAREVMELFTLGRGNYSERDIKEAARAFTGWGFDASGNFVFRKFQHDDGMKEIFGKRGQFTGEDVLDMLLERPETAEYICGKLYTYFVDGGNTDTERIAELSAIFKSNQYDILPVIFHIMDSEWFRSSQGKKVKSPVDLLAGLSTMMQVRYTDAIGAVKLQKALGQVLLNPPGVAGWNHGEAWIDSATLMLRLMLPKALVMKGKMAGKVEMPRQLRQLTAELDMDLLRTSYANFTNRELQQALLLCDMPQKGGEEPFLKITSSLEFQIS